jgi:hypothetical protein
MIDFNKITKAKQSYLNDFDLSDLEKIGFKMQNNLLYPPGDSPFKLYAFISTLFDGKTILDVGTQYGNSALSFSYNENNQVISYNIIDEGASVIDRENITWKVMDFRNDDSIDYDNVEVICIDVDPHDGRQEVQMIDFLEKKKWSGILLLDDIHKNAEMENFWNSINYGEDVKYDVTHIGHSSGTGLIVM